MDRSRSKRNYYYDHQDYDGEPMGRTKPRYNNNHHFLPNNHRHRGNNNNPNNNGGNNGRPPNKGGGGGGSGGAGGGQDSSLMVTTSYRILCQDMKAGGVIGKSGSIIKSIRQHTGAWINVHELIPGDEERIIEISDTRRRDPEGRMPSFSPAQEALFLVHERILESESHFGFGGGMEEEDEYGVVARGGGNRVASRLVVSRMHVGSLLGKGGRIIEQMRMETKTQIRILPRDHTLPRCVSMSEEIVQVVGDINAVKNAISVISSRLRESQHRDRSNHFQGRMHSPERFFPEDDYIPPVNNASRKSSMDGSFGSRMSTMNYRGNNYSSRPSGFIEAGTAATSDSGQPLYGEDLVFRILCPIGKVDNVFGEPYGIVDLLQSEIGVDVKVTDPMAGSNERIITISSEEGPDDELFPAQEALLHIQTQIVDLGPDKDNIVTTRLLVPSSEIGCLEERDGSLSKMKRLTGANIQILPREELPSCVSGPNEIVQIVGEIKAARDALVEITSRLRSYLYREFSQDPPPPPISATNISPNITPARDGQTASDLPAGAYQNVQIAATPSSSKEVVKSGAETVKQTEFEHHEDVPSSISRLAVPLVTRSTLDVVIPDYAVSKLIAKSKNKLAQISELSGANVTLVEDRPNETRKIIQISGTPEQCERAQSLLQGFILSTQEDGP